MRMKLSLVLPEPDVLLASGPPFDCVGRRATMRLPLDTGPLRSGRTDQVNPCCGVQLPFPKQWGMLIFGRDLPRPESRTPQRPTLRLRGKTRYRAPSTRHRATPFRANGQSEPLLRCATAISQAMGYVDLWARLAQQPRPWVLHSPAACPSTAWEDALPCAFHSTQGHSAQGERIR